MSSGTSGKMKAIKCNNETLHVIGDLIEEGLEEKIWVHLEVLARS